MRSEWCSFAISNKVDHLTKSRLSEYHLLSIIICLVDSATLHLFFQAVYHRLKVLRQRRFPAHSFPGAGMGYGKPPGVQLLPLHQGLEALVPEAG